MSDAGAQAMQFIANGFGDELLYEVNRSTFDRLGSSALYTRHFGNRLAAADTLYIVVGTDSGLLPRWIVDRGPGNGSRYLFVELDELRDPIVARRPELQDREKIAVVDGSGWQEQLEAFRLREYGYLDRVQVIHSFGALDANLSAYQELRFAVEEDVERRLRLIKQSLGNHSFMRRQIDNIADNLLPAKLLAGRFENRTAVLLGGGPSLDLILPWVKRHRDRLVVFAVSRIARQLLENDVQPDVVASVDPHDISMDVSKDMLLFGPECLLLSSYHVYPPLLSQWRGQHVFRGTRYPWSSKADVDNLPGVGPTVSNTALAMAVDMGFSRIILGGVDLCFSPEGHTHASGSEEHQIGPCLGNVGLQVETNDGRRADTDHPFRQAIDSLAAQATAAQQRGCQLINPAPHAARIAGVDYQPLDALQAPDTTADFRQRIGDALPSLDLNARRRRLKEAGAELARVNGRLRAIVKLAEDALSCNHALFGRDRNDPDFKYKKRMDKIERQLDRDYKDLTPLIKTFGVQHFLRLTLPDRKHDWTDEQLEHFGDAYYQAYVSSSRDLLSLVENAQTRIAMRLMEIDAAPDIERLSRFWHEDSSPGRVHVWPLINPEAPGPQDDPHLAMLADEFQALLAFRNAAYRGQVIEGRGMGLGPVRAKLRAMFDRTDTDELERLRGVLTDMDEDGAADLAALAGGYLAELAGDQPAALGHYQQILDHAAAQLAESGEIGQNPVLEDALRRMSYITLNNHDEANALMVMDVLSAISPVYEPQYADLLRMTGHTAEAINVYTDYLQKVPGDLTQLLKLGMVYQEIGQTESARWAFSHVLEQDPGNDSAGQLLSRLDGHAAP